MKFIVTKVLRLPEGNKIIPQFRIFESETDAINDCIKLQETKIPGVTYGVEPIDNSQLANIIDKFGRGQELTLEDIL